MPCKKACEAEPFNDGTVLVNGRCRCRAICGKIDGTSVPANYNLPWTISDFSLVDPVKSV